MTKTTRNPAGSSSPTPTDADITRKLTPDTKRPRSRGKGSPMERGVDAGLAAGRAESAATIASQSARIAELEAERDALLDSIQSHLSARVAEATRTRELEGALKELLTAYSPTVSGQTNEAARAGAKHRARALLAK